MKQSPVFMWQAPGHIEHFANGVLRLYSKFFPIFETHAIRALDSSGFSQNGGESFIFLYYSPFHSLKNAVSFLCSQPAVNLRVQIHLHPPNTKGLIVECHSGGWFPRPLIEWRDDRGKVIPAASKSHSQDGDKLFIMNTTLLVKDSSSQKVICCFQNPLTGQEQRTSVVLSGKVWVFVLQYQLLQII